MSDVSRHPRRRLRRLLHGDGGPASDVRGFRHLVNAREAPAHALWGLPGFSGTRRRPARGKGCTAPGGDPQLRSWELCRLAAIRDHASKRILCPGLGLGSPGSQRFKGEEHVAAGTGLAWCGERHDRALAQPPLETAGAGGTLGDRPPRGQGFWESAGLHRHWGTHRESPPTPSLGPEDSVSPPQAPGVQNVPMEGAVDGGDRGGPAWAGHRAHVWACLCFLESGLINASVFPLCQKHDLEAPHGTDCLCHRGEMSQIWARSRFHALLLNHGPLEGPHRSKDASRGTWGTSPALGLTVTDPRRRWRVGASGSTHTWSATITASPGRGSLRALPGQAACRLIVLTTRHRP